MLVNTARPSALRHWAWSVWRRHDPSTCYMLIIQPSYNTSSTQHTAYFDASGKKEQPVLVVSGFVASEKQWLRFEEEWDALLGEFQLAHPFHTTDYVAAVQGTQYEQFSDNRDRREDFEAAAVRILKQTRKPFSFGVYPQQ